MPTSPVTDILAWDPVLSGITQALCIYAVVAGSNASLKRWIAVSSLTVPEPVEEVKEEMKPPAAPLTGWRRIFNKATAAKLAIFVIACTPSVFIWVILPRIKSQIVHDGFWAALSFLLFFSIAHIPINMMFPAKETTAQYKHCAVSPRGFVLLFQSKQMKHVRSIAAAVLTVAGMSSTYFGYRAFQPLGAATWVVGIAATYILPRMTMKYMVLVLNGYLLSIPALTGVIAAATMFFSKVAGKSDAPSTGGGSKTNMTPSDWVINLLTPFSAGMPTVAVGVMLALALRYDYSRSAPIALPGGPGEAAVVPRKVASFRRPTFNAGLAGLVTALVGMSIGATYLPECMPMAIEILAIVATIPVTTIAMVLSVWRRGELASWWKYEECWVPKAEKAVPAKVDVEAAPASNDEKASLLTAA